MFDRNKDKVMIFPSPEKRRRSCQSKPQPDPAPDSVNDEDYVASAAPTSAPPSPPDVRQLNFDKVMAEAEILRLQSQVNDLTKQLEYMKVRLSYKNIKTDKMLHHLTGLPTKTHFDILHSLCTRIEFTYFKDWRVTCLNTEDQLLLILMKMRLNSSLLDLGLRFGVSEATVDNVFHTWLFVLHDILVEGIKGIPSVRKNQACLPGCFSEFANCRIILDCTEIQCANDRGHMDIQRQTYSNYKSRNTFKVLVGVAPNGVITYVSEMYPGSKSDKEIVRDSGVLNEMEPGDLVLADKGFLIHDLMPQGVSLNLPPFLTNGTFTRQESVFTIKIARARVHVERAIGRIKQYSVLNFLPRHMRQFATILFKVCAALVNMQNPIISEVAGNYEGVGEN